MKLNVTCPCGCGHTFEVDVDVRNVSEEERERRRERLKGIVRTGRPKGSGDAKPRKPRSDKGKPRFSAAQRAMLAEYDSMTRDNEGTP